MSSGIAEPLVLSDDLKRSGDVRWLRRNEVTLPIAGGGPPIGAQYLVLAADATLTQERILTPDAVGIQGVDGGAGAAYTLSLKDDGVTNARLANVGTSTIKGRITAATGDPEDLTPAQVRTIINVADGANNYSHPNHSGEVTSAGDGAQTIIADAVTNAKLANVPTATFKGRTTAATGDPEDLTTTQATALLNEFVGDAGAGGTKGLVKTPAIGDATKYLRGDATWSSPPTGSVTMGAAAIAFTDGDTVRRVTITDAAVGVSSKIIFSIQRPNVTDANDVGYLYVANIVTVAAGSFDILVACTGWATDEMSNNPPNETVTLIYTLG